MRLLLTATMVFVSLSLTACGGIVLEGIPQTVPTDILTVTYNGKTLTLELPASPTPATYGPGYNFTVAATATLSTGVTCADGLEFYTNPLGGGGFADTCIQGLAPYIDPGVQMFTGNVTDPTFVPGIYPFNVGGMAGVLTIAVKPPIAAASSMDSSALPPR